MLLALCKAAPALQTLPNAEKLLLQLSPYMAESFTQHFAPSPFLRDAEPSPWECLTSNLTTAMLSIGTNFPRLRPAVLDTTSNYLYRVLSASESMSMKDDVNDIACLVTSVVGFLESCSKVTSFWTPIERTGLVNHIRDILSERFLVTVEATFSTIRNSHKKGPNQWKRYSRHYESLGRPLGAMLLQYGLMKLLASSASLLVSNSASFYDGDVLDIFIEGHKFDTSVTEEEVATVETLAGLAAEGVAIADDGASYIGASMTGGQQLAYAVKAHALSAYCTCVSLSTAADASQLLEWLQSTMFDSAQMSNVALAKATLKSLAVLCRDEINVDNGFTGILHRFIVEGAPGPGIVKVAAKCLSYILKHSTQDAIITTLNTMGHVLSSTSPERALRAGTLQPFEQQAMSSTLSLVSTDEAKNVIYFNAVETIVGVASNCKDPQVCLFCGTV